MENIARVQNRYSTWDYQNRDPEPVPGSGKRTRCHVCGEPSNMPLCFNHWMEREKNMGTFEQHCKTIHLPH